MCMHKREHLQQNDLLETIAADLPLTHRAFYPGAVLDALA